MNSFQQNNTILVIFKHDNYHIAILSKKPHRFGVVYQLDYTCKSPILALARDTHPLA